MRGMTAVEFSEFFQAEATAGTVIKVLPSVPVSTQQQSMDNVRVAVTCVFVVTMIAVVL